jgi:uncharacterized membrane protein YbhN (UPF0104 family)
MALVANYLAVAARTVLWWRFLRVIAVPSFGLAVRATIVGMALQCVLVGNAGEAGRVLLVMRTTGQRARAVITSVVLERLVVSTGYLVVLVAGGLCLTFPAALDRWRLPAVAMLCVGGVLVGLVARKPDERCVSRGGRRARDLSRGVAALHASIREASVGAGGYLIVALTAVNWGAQLATFHWAAMAMDLPITIGGSAIAMLTVLASGSIRATPANMGVTQLAYVTTAAMLGLSGEVALQVALLLQGIQTIPIMLAGLFLLPDLAMATQPRPRLTPYDPSPASRCRLGLGGSRDDV